MKVTVVCLFMGRKDSLSLDTLDSKLRFSHVESFLK